LNWNYLPGLLLFFFIFFDMSIFDFFFNPQGVLAFAETLFSSLLYRPLYLFLMYGLLLSSHTCPFPPRSAKH
jgi:hypothetical protein